MQLIPMGQNVVVKVKDPEKQSKGGIILPDNLKEKPKEGVIVKLCYGGVNGMDEGDRIFFPSFAGSEVSLDGKTFLIIPSADILAVIKE